MRSRIRSQFRQGPRCLHPPVRSLSTSLRHGLNPQAPKPPNLLAFQKTFHITLNQSSILHPRSTPWLATLLALLTISAIASTLPTKPELNDASSSTSPLPNPTSPSKGVKGLVPDNDSQPIDQIPTSNPAVPYFPRKIYLPSAPTPTTPSPPSEEYILLGLGLRTVSFLRIKVYLIGLYIAKSDLATLQSAMIHTITPSGSTLVEDEKLALRSKLLAPEASEQIWGHVLGKESIRSAIRVVPVRATNMGHMRDGFVRMVGAGGKREGVEHESGFNEAVGGLKAVM
ncbi:MAG: hypothetical protein Q9195_009613, partial [Heterodermia aff. obscurata]